mmetsp:Transcript_27428/g.74934  ORF Transcript_27428/g.74934 Transcript_27428/m.74934 type:complete len:227 (+) Transcript_27428:414-1094(+)
MSMSTSSTATGRLATASSNISRQLEVQPSGSRMSGSADRFLRRASRPSSDVTKECHAGTMGSRSGSGRLDCASSRRISKALGYVSLTWAVKEAHKSGSLYMARTQCPPSFASSQRMQLSSKIAASRRERTSVVVPMDTLLRMKPSVNRAPVVSSDRPPPLGVPAIALSKRCLPVRRLLSAATSAPSLPAPGAPRPAPRLRRTVRPERDTPPGAPGLLSSLPDPLRP